MVYLIDLSGIVDTIKRVIWRWVFGKDKPFQDFEFKPLSCSLCMVHHTLLIYLLCTHSFTIWNYVVVCVLSFLSSNIAGFMRFIKELLVKTENKLYDIFL